MDKIAFEEITHNSGIIGESMLLAMILINGRPLGEILEPYERAAAAECGDEYPGFNYIYHFADDLKTELGGTENNGGWSDVMICGSCEKDNCGRTISVNVEVSGNEVVWKDISSDFERGSLEYERGWDYSTFPVFRFDKAQYITALNQLEEIAGRQNRRNGFIEAHKYCHREERDAAKDTVCGCFYCLEIFPAEEYPNRMFCPYCGIDSVIGDSSGYPITTAFLKQMRAYWFRSDCPRARWAR